MRLCICIIENRVTQPESPTNRIAENKEVGRITFSEKGKETNDKCLEPPTHELHVFWMSALGSLSARTSRAAGHLNFNEP